MEENWECSHFWDSFSFCSVLRSDRRNEIIYHNSKNKSNSFGWFFLLQDCRRNAIRFQIYLVGLLLWRNIFISLHFLRVSLASQPFLLSSWLEPRWSPNKKSFLFDKHVTLKKAIFDAIYNVHWWLWFWRRTRTTTNKIWKCRNNVESKMILKIQIHLKWNSMFVLFKIWKSDSVFVSPEMNPGVNLWTQAMQ